MVSFVNYFLAFLLFDAFPFRTLLVLADDK